MGTGGGNGFVSVNNNPFVVLEPTCPLAAHQRPIIAVPLHWTLCTSDNRRGAVRLAYMGTLDATIQYQWRMTLALAPILAPCTCHLATFPTPHISTFPRPSREPLVNTLQSHCER